MKWYRDPIIWILVIRAIVVLGGFLLLVWVAANIEVTVNF